MNEVIRYSPGRQAMLAVLGEVAEKRSISKPTSNVVDLPRVCAVHDRFYMSRYIDHGNGQIVYARGIKIIGSVQDQYRNYQEAGVLFRSADFSNEICPWCGAEGHAAIKCTQCNAEVCYGRTDSADIFQCRTSCGRKSKVRYETRDGHGVRPGLADGKPRV